MWSDHVAGRYAQYESWKKKTQVEVFCFIAAPVKSFECAFCVLKLFIKKEYKTFHWSALNQFNSIKQWVIYNVFDI